MAFPSATDWQEDKTQRRRIPIGSEGVRYQRTYVISHSFPEGSYPVPGDLMPGESDTVTAARLQQVVDAKPTKAGKLRVTCEFFKIRTA